MKKFTLFAILAASAVLAPAAAAQADLLEGKTVYTLGEAKTWSNGENSYTFVTEDLAKLTATPTNTANVFLYPENGAINTEENQQKGAQAFYVDMESSQSVSTVSTTWEGAAADSYKIYLTDETPTLAILDTDAAYEVTGLGQYTAHTAVINDGDGATGRYLVFVPTKATNWGWGMKIRSIKAYAPAKDELTVFTAAPGIVQLGTPVEMKFGFKNQLGLDLAADKVTLAVSDNATLEGNLLTVNSGTEATLTASMDGKSLSNVVYVATAPAAPAAEDIKTPVFTNTVTDKNATAGYVVEYNGGAINNGTLTFDNGTVAQSFGNARCIFFYNSETTGAWNGNIDAAALGYRSLCLDVFATKDAKATIEFEGSTNPEVAATNPVELKAGQWNHVEVVIMDSKLNNMSIRLDEANMCDLLLANIYFTAAFVEGDEEAPVLADPVSALDQNYTGVTLTLNATDNMQTIVYYTVACESKARAAKMFSFSGKPGEEINCDIKGLDFDTDYTFSVTAYDGKNRSEAKTVEVSTLALPAAPQPVTNPASVQTPLYSAFYNNGVANAPAFANWGSTGQYGVVSDADGKENLYFSNYDGQYGGLDNLNHTLADNHDEMHIAIFGAHTDGQITLAPVWANATGDTPNTVLDVKANQWNTYYIPLSEFGHPNHGNVINQLSFTQSTLPNFAVNNIYFYNKATSGVDNIAADTLDNEVVSVYTLQGVEVRTNVERAAATADLTPGLYIVRGAKAAVKVIVK